MHVVISTVKRKFSAARQHRLWTGLTSTATNTWKYSKVGKWWSAPLKGGQPYLNRISMVAAESCLLVHVTLETSKAMSAESMSSLSSHTCIKVNLDKVNIFQLLDWSNLQTKADWDFLALLILLHPSAPHQTQCKQTEVNNYTNQLMKLHSNHKVTYCTVKLSFQWQCTSFSLK